MIFPKYYTDQLTEIFLKKENGAQSVAGSSPVSDTVAIEDVDGEAFEDEPMNENEDVDGEPLDDVDGEPMEDDVDGEPMEDDSSVQQFEHINVHNKQETEVLYTEVEDMFS